MRNDVIEPIERAVKDDRVTGLAAVLEQLNAAGTFEDPSLSPPLDEHYARKPLWQDPAGKFVIVCMTWAPGQGTPLHDHGGLWGAEVVVSGTMHERAYRAIERDGERRMRFVHEGDIERVRRSVGILVPPYEYHAYRNAGTTVSHTVHVYAGTLETCTTYEREAGDWWTAQRGVLRYDR